MATNKVSALDVAKYILEKTGQTMSTMQLQKLLYYCQAWHAAWTNRPLFDETFEAWANGPVCYALYDHHRGKYAISVATLDAGSADRLAPEQAEVVDRILAAYLPLNGLQLSQLTHSERPWLDARGDLPSGARSREVISWKAMRSYYADLAKDPTATLVAELVGRPA